MSKLLAYFMRIDDTTKRECLFPQENETQLLLFVSVYTQVALNSENVLFTSRLSKANENRVLTSAIEKRR